MRLLARAFVEGFKGQIDAGEDLESTLSEALARARAAFPDIAMDDARFVRCLARHAAPERVPSNALARMRVDELFLAWACAEQDPRALAIFEERCLAPAATALLRSGLEQAGVDDALQLLRERLFVDGKIRDFAGRGSLAGWVRVSLARAHTSMQRTVKGTVSFDGERDLGAATAIDPELALARRRYGDAFQRAFQDALAAMSPEQRNVLRLHFVDGLNLESIATVIGVSRATAGRRMFEAKAALLDKTLALLGERLNVSLTELESILNVVRSALHVSLGGLLRE